MREIMLNGYIDDEVWFGDEITPDALHTLLYAEDKDHTEDVHIRLNSYGGSCNAAVRMHDDMVAYPGKVNITISGTAASAATVFCMAADHLEMTPGSLFMIHDPSIVAIGNVRDLKDAIHLLEACKESILNVYETRIKVTRDQAASMMTKTTWMDAQKALEDGFIDSILSVRQAGPTGCILPLADAEKKVQAWIDRHTKAQFLWEKYESGSWTTVKAEATGANGNTLTVNAADVVTSATYRCRARYNNGSVYCYDTITIIDKTDNYQADIDSTAGDVFKNTVGQTCLICRLWQNGAEVDPLKSTTYSAAAPASPAAGDFYYQITTTTPTTKLMRYSGSKWEDVTSNATYKHTKTYKWYRRDKDGNPLDSGAVFATGKVIYVDGDDVTVKTVFVCEVE